MPNNPKESDWKLYSKRVSFWRERYLERKNKELIEMLTEKGKTPTEQFWQTKDAMQKEARILVDCLDQHARSKMFFNMSLMHGYGLIEDPDLEDFSEELRNRLLRAARDWDEQPINL